MRPNTIIQLDDIGLFRRRRSHELYSQRERAEMIRDEFARCMDRALIHADCVMPGLCAHGDPVLSCAHLHVDYRNFTGNGIPLPKDRRVKLDSRLRAIGTQIYRLQTSACGPLPGDIHIPSLQQVRHFTGTRKRPPAKRSGGWLSSLFR